MASDLLSGLRVLIVDDNQDAAESIAWLLADFGAKTRAVGDATGIVDLVREFDPGLVLLDLTLPKVDGYEACRRIRGYKGVRPYIAAVTGWGGAEVQRQCLQCGFDLHLTKPVSVQVLVGVAQQALARLTNAEAD